MPHSAPTPRWFASFWLLPQPPATSSKTFSKTPRARLIGPSSVAEANRLASPRLEAPASATPRSAAGQERAGGRVAGVGEGRADGERLHARLQLGDGRLTCGEACVGRIGDAVRLIVVGEKGRR